MLQRIRTAVRIRWYDYLLNSFALALPDDFYTTTDADKKILKQSDAFGVYRRLLISYARTLRTIRGQGGSFVVALQALRVRRIMRIAQDIPFWRKRFQSLGIQARSVRTLEDLRKLPPVTRADLKVLPLEELTSSFEVDTQRIQTNSTAGTTTGVPFRIRFPRSVALVNLAGHYFRVMQTYGVPVEALSERDFILGFNMFGGERPVSTVPEQFLAYTNIDRGADIDAQIDTFLKVAERLGPCVLMSHPSELFYLVQQLKKRNVRPDIRFCLVIGQLLEQEVRQFAEGYLKAKVMSVYGLREFMLSGEECPVRPNTFHTQGERTYVEILDDTDNSVEDGVYGNVTLTGLDNRLMPLIRYQSGDRARLLAGTCPCGNPNQLFELEQRASDIFEFPDGTVRSIKAISQALMSEPFVSAIARYQIRQEKTDLIRVLVVPMKEGDRAILLQDDSLSKRLRAALRAPAEVAIAIDVVDDINSAGKYKPFISLASFRASTQRSPESL